MPEKISRRGTGSRSPILIAALAAILILIAFVPILFNFESSSLSVFVFFGARVMVLVIAILILLSASFLGRLVIRLLRIRLSAFPELLLFSAGVGVGLLSLLVLLLGSTLSPSRLSGLFWLLLLLLFCGPGVVIGLKVPSKEERSKWRLSTFEMILLGLLILAFLINWVSGFLPPLDYDVLEYHLGAPKCYLEAGRIGYLPGNVYSNFPFNMEMLYYLSMLIGEATAGPILASMLNLTLGLLAAGCVWRIGNKFFGKPTGAIAATFFYVMPGVTEVSIKTYSENGWILFTSLSILAFLSFVTGEREKKWIILSGLCAGFAAGCKYPALLLLVLPLLLFLLVEGWVRSNFRHALKHSVIFVLAAAVVFSPWLVKNTVLTGNPTYPLLYNVFGGKDWTPEKDARWKRAHAATPRDVVSMAKRLSNWFFSNPWMSLPAFIFAPLLVLGRKRKGPILWLLALFLAHALLWLLFTHRIDRFMLPALPALATLSAAGFSSVENRFGAWTLRSVAIFLLAMTVFQIAATVMPLIPDAMETDLSHPERTYRKYVPFWHALEFLEDMSGGAKVLAVGEARSFLFGPNVITRTVFDESPLPDLPAKQVHRFLRENGYRYIFVNWNEIARFQRTYAFTFEGSEHGGFSDFIGKDYFDELVGAGVLEKPIPFVKKLDGGEYRVEIYRVAEGETQHEKK